MLRRIVLALLIAAAPTFAYGQSYGTSHFGAVISDGAVTAGSVVTPSLKLGAFTLTGVGTTAGTVAAGNDNRIVGAAQKSANLSDLASAPAARTALGAAASGANTDITSLNGPSLGAATATAPSAGDSSSRVPTTAFVTAAIGAATGAAGQITGLLPSAIPTGSTVTISAGAASDSTNTVLISGGPFSWAASNGNAANGYQGGTTLPASSTIHFFTIKGSAGVASFASTSLTPTLPSGYTYFRRIFSLRTNGSNALVGGVPVETGGGAITFWLTTPTLDFSTGVGVTSRTLVPLNVPAGIKVQPLYRMNVSASNNPSAVLITSGDESDIALAQGGNAPWTMAPGLDIDTTPAVLNVGGSSGQVGMLTTDASGQIGLRAFSGQVPNVYWVTRGFVDFRRN